MGNNNIGTTVVVLTIIIIMLAGLNFISSDIQDNPNLDNASSQLIFDLNYQYVNNFNANDSINNSQANGTVSEEDDFSRQFLEDKNQITQKKSTINKILNLPSLILLIFGVSNVALLIAWNTLIYSLLVFMIGLQIYKAIRTGEVD